MLEKYIKDRLKEKKILLMTHIVLGYPDFETSFRLAEVMVKSGVDIMELQIPFSEPIADGPKILYANEQALQGGATVEKCFESAAKIVDAFSIPFLFMSYYNILYQYGVKNFAEKAAETGIKAMIVPDAPPEEAPEYIEALNDSGLSPIQFFTPNTSAARMQYLSDKASGFVYCIARKGVTGQETRFSEQLTKYLADCRKVSPCPLAVGFGIKDRNDIDFLQDKADIAVIGSHALRVLESDGVEAVGKYIKGLR